jgi:putative endonuclease
MDARRRLGQAGEEMAARLLTESGLKIIERNWRCAAGEIDLVAQEVAPDYALGGALVPWLVIVEVRIRRGDHFGTAKASITPTKQNKVRALAEMYVQATNWQGPWRIDVVAIQLDSQGHMVEKAHVRHAVTG